MNRGIDHVVLCGRDLNALASNYEQLGFTLTPRAQHPFGTGNQLAQLDGDFIELLSVTQPEDVPAATAMQFSFGAYNQEFVADGEGFSMLALKSNGWEADRAHFEAQGMKVWAPFEFSRLAGQPDGSEVRVGFKLTIANYPDLPKVVFFTCDHQHEPKYFYKPQFQSHLNTATGIAEILMVADEPMQLKPHFESLIGAASVHQYDDNLSVEAGRSVITVSRRSDISERFLGAAIGQSSDTRFVGYGVYVRDIDAAELVLEKRHLKFQRRGKSLWLCGPETSNVIIEFSEMGMVDG